MSQIPMTVQGAQRLRDELHELKSVKRPEIIQAIAEAREHGDLKETPNIMPLVKHKVSVKVGSKILKVN